MGRIGVIIDKEVKPKKGRCFSPTSIPGKYICNICGKIEDIRGIKTHTDYLCRTFSKRIIIKIEEEPKTREDRDGNA